MERQRWPRFDERTGNPERDNEARRRNRQLRRLAQRGLRVVGVPRKRKKAIVRAEGARYIAVISKIAVRMAAGPTSDGGARQAH